MDIDELLKEDTTPKVFVLTSKTRKSVINKIGIEEFKNELRRFGFNVAYVMDDISGPVKEKIWV
jgi:hypothetical protein